MIYHSLYHFYTAHQKGKATDPIKYFAIPENQDLGIVKRQRKPNIKLIVAPNPDRPLATEQFFFQASEESPLTTTALQPDSADKALRKEGDRIRCLSHSLILNTLNGT